MKRITLFLAVVAMSVSMAKAQGYGITFGELEVTAENAADIFGNGKAAYDATQNTLTLQDGFNYHLSTNFVTIATGNDFHIRLEGNAEMAASIDCSDNLFIETSEPQTLKITSNISGSALKCPNLTIENNVTLDLLSRNSQDGMFALDCADNLTVNGAILLAEVTTSRMAVATRQLNLNNCWLQKPRGGTVSQVEGGICFGDGIPAKQVRIVVEGFGIDENLNTPTEKVHKVFENGQVLIIKEGKRYNLKGQEIK